jgi:hypothetical protein
VTVRKDGAGAVSASAISPSGVTAGQAAVLISPSSPGQLTLNLTSSVTGGFGVGEFIKIYFDIVPGSTPQPGDFTITGFSQVDLPHYNILAALTPSFTLTIQ